jgi:hypothetical protein
MVQKITEVLQSINSVKILKGPVTRKQPEIRNESGEVIEKAHRYYDCVLLVKDKLMPVTFYEDDDIKARLDETCKKWKITYLL